MIIHYLKSPPPWNELQWLVFEKGRRMELQLDKEEEEKTNLVPFRPAIITGGRDGGEPWLLLLEEGSIFLIRNEKESKSELLLCRLVWKSALSALICFQKTGHEHYVYPFEFCRENKCHEVLHRGEILVDGNRPNQSE